MDSQPEAAGLRQRGDLNPGLSTFASCRSDRGESAQSSGLLRRCGWGAVTGVQGRAAGSCE